MKPLSIGVCVGSLGIGELREAFSVAAELGCEVVQLTGLPASVETLQPQQVLDWAHQAGLEIVSGSIVHAGEDYTTLETIHRTGGLAMDVAARMDDYRRAGAWLGQAGIGYLTAHVGFIPAQAGDPQRSAMLQRVGDAVRTLGEFGVKLALETGQETAEGLQAFLADLRAEQTAEAYINFDPANMILYGKGDPVAALDRLHGQIVSVHCKDAVSSDRPGQSWGEEVPFGTGDVDARRWLGRLIDLGFRGPLLIEREAGATRRDDIAAAVAVIRDALATRP